MSENLRAPWRVEYSHDRQEGNDQRPMPFVVDKRGSRVARMWVRQTSHEAKANLIAAAPDLLAALKSAVASANDRRRRSLDAASYHNKLDGVGQEFDYISAEPLPPWVLEAEAAIAKAEGRS